MMAGRLNDRANGEKIVRIETMPRVVLDAPSNLGLRPPAPGVVPGVYNLAGALRDQELLARLGAQDGGVVTPPRYLPDWDGHTTRNAPAIAAYSQRLADRVGLIIGAGRLSDRPGWGLQYLAWQPFGLAPSRSLRAGLSGWASGFPSSRQQFGGRSGGR